MVWFSFLSDPVLANAALFQAGIESSQNVSEQWRNTWEMVIGYGSISGSVLYSAIANTGAIFAVGSAVIYIVQVIKDNHLDRSDEVLYFDPVQLIRYFLVFVLLTNNGALLRTGLLAGYNAFHELNQQILEITVTGVRLDEVYRQAQGVGNAQNVISQLVRQCESTMGEKQQQCLDSALERSIALVEQMESVYGRSSWLEERLADLNEIRQAIGEQPSALMFASPIYWAVAGPLWETAAFTLLWAWQGAFQSAVELVSLLVALFAPLAVGGAILPMGGAGALGLWFVGFISISLLKLSFNIMAGLAAVTFVNSSLSDPLIFPMIVAVFAPVFSVLIVTGGGLGVWMGLTSFVEKASSAAIRVF